MNAGKDEGSASPELPDQEFVEAMENRYVRAMKYYENVRKGNLVGASQPSDGLSELSQELHQLGICLHSRSNSKESQVSGRTSFSLKDISNSREFARAHRRTSSKLLTFDDSDPSKSSILVKSINQSYGNILGPTQRAEDSREGSLALISEYPSSVCEEQQRTLGSDTSRSAPYAIDIDLRGREGSTILSNLSSDSSRAVCTIGEDSEDPGARERSGVVYVSAASVPLPREPLEINLFESQVADKGDFRGSVNSSRLPAARKLYCPTCKSEVVPILSFQPTEVSWWKRVFMLSEMVRCCHEARPQHEDVVHICRKCARELYRSRAR